MGNPQHLEWLLEGGTLWNKRRKDEPFEPDLSDFDIFKAFNDADNLIWNGSLHLNNIDLSNANLSGADFGNSTRCNDADFSGAILTGARATGMFVDRTRFTRANFSGATMTGLSGDEKSQFGEAILDGANLDRARLDGAYFAGASFVGASVIGANLSHAVLSNAVFRRADLSSTEFADAQLEDSDLRSAKMSDVYFARARLDGAEVSTEAAGDDGDRQGPLIFTDLRNCNGLTQRQLNTMSGDSGTLIPRDLHCPPDWPAIAVQNSNRSTKKFSHWPPGWLSEPPHWVKSAALYATIVSAIVALVSFLSD